MSAIAVSVLSGISNTLLPNKVSLPVPLSTNEVYRIVFCQYKLLSKEDIHLLRKYGNVIIYDSCYKNINCNQLKFEYLLLDFTNVEQRTYYQKYILGNIDSYRVILYRYAYETNNGFSVHNELTKLPNEEAFKKDFDFLLLQETIPSPRCCISLYRMLFGNTQVQVSN